MTPDELPRNEAAKWLRQAAKDRNAAQALLEPSRRDPCFTASKLAEKAIKAFLAFHQTPFRKTHDLADLGSQCATVDPSLEAILREVADLTDYASAFRYPDAPYEPDADEAARALAAATELSEEIRRRVEGGMES